MSKSFNNKVKLNDSVSVKDFGAIGDGVTDDTVALQTALNLGQPVFLPLGRYRITSGLVWVDGSFLFSNEAPLFFQNPINTPAIGTVSEIYYDGVGGSTSVICQMSRVTVGTKPVYLSDESQTLQQAGISGVLLNGNGKAAYGLYSARAGLGNVYKNVCVTGTLTHAFWFGEFWLSQLQNLFALHNSGCGITIGQDTFSWSGGNTVNSVDLFGLSAYYNGKGLTSWTTADYEKGFGIGLYLGRACRAEVLDAEYNNGVGILWEASSGSSSASEIYTENNCYQYPTSSQRYQIWYQGGVNSFQQEIDGMYFLFNYITPTGNTNAPRIKITGSTTAPFTEQDAPVFRRLVGNVVVEADLGAYRVERHAAVNTSRYVSNYPLYNDKNTISSPQTTLYVAATATGTGSGIDTSNYATLDDAMKVAAVVSSITTIDVSNLTATGAAAATKTIDGSNFTRALTITGGTTGRFNNFTDTAVLITNWSNKLTIKDMVVIERCYITNSTVEIKDCPVIRSGINTTVAGAVNVTNSMVEISGTSVINVSNSTATTKIGLSSYSNSQIAFTNAAAGTIVSFTAGNAIHFNAGGGIVQPSITTVTATWAAAANVTRNNGGGAIIAPNGLNP